ncbi:NAD-dependent epimerase/dehydratase family protein [Mobilicoccus caccae]|uniref:Reductase n=1 Tax=Mobilicoccus caccae TaxID=1859295 RepID=A0ABQ6IK56_9MICO|nr:NAD-dependent epimerase/dehydratase family protein [Mobilicoccus caccae]GMA38126.1 reductase [Mobilicoccus caccae]
MDFLILGGTAWLGRRVAEIARDRGHDVTCLARGSEPAPEGVRFIRADRDDEDGLSGVRDRRWSAVVDVARQPGQVRRAMRQLEAEHVVFVSSISVYTRNDLPDRDESAPVHEPLAADELDDMSQYGPAKVACERIVRETASSSTVIRAGLIGGAGDHTGRTGYYPWRFAHPTGADVLVPPDDSYPVAMIDAEDLAAWIVEVAERRVDGIFDATGPAVPLGEVLECARAVAGSSAPPRAADPEALASEGVGFWMGPTTLPLWVGAPGWRYATVADASAARSHGLTTRPLAQTLAAALTFEESRGGPRGAGLTDEEERRLRAALSGQ